MTIYLLFYLFTQSAILSRQLLSVRLFVILKRSCVTWLWILSKRWWRLPVLRLSKSLTSFPMVKSSPSETNDSAAQKRSSNRPSSVSGANWTQASVVITGVSKPSLRRLAGVSLVVMGGQMSSFNDNLCFSLARIDNCCKRWYKFNYIFSSMCFEGNALYL